MSDTDQECMEGGDGINFSHYQGSSNNRVPKQMEEALNLISVIYRRLEDCAIKWQSIVSQEQWRTLNSRTLSNKSWAQSVLSRTYFTDASLDEAFKHLLQLNKKLIKHLHSFVALLREEEPLISNQESGDMQGSSNSNYQIDNFIVPVDLSVMEDSCTENTRKKKKPSDCQLSKNVQESFSNLMEAKLNFDTKFLTFDTALNGESNIALNTSKCICNICTNVVETTPNEEKLRKVANPRQRAKRGYKKKPKRLLKSNRVSNRLREKNITEPLNQISDKMMQVTSRG